MTIAYNVTLVMRMTTVITKSASEVPALGEHSLVANAYDSSRALNASSTPVVTKVLKKTQGNGTLDLTAAVDDDGDIGTQDMSGLKLQAFKIANSADNSNTLTISDPANPYSLNGTKDIVLAPGEEIEVYCPETKADVAAGAKDILFTIAGGETVDLIMCFG